MENESLRHAMLSFYINESNVQGVKVKYINKINKSGSILSFIFRPHPSFCKPFRTFELHTLSADLGCVIVWSLLAADICLQLPDYCNLT